MSPRQLREWMKGDGAPPDGELQVYYSNRPAYERERMLKQSERAGREMFADGLANELMPGVDPSDVPGHVLGDGPHYRPRGTDRRKDAPDEV